jgi:hypothetical protein
MPKHQCFKETEIALLREKINNDHSMMLEIHAAVIGEKDQPGLKGRVERIENTQNNIITGGGFVAVVLGAFMAIIAFFKK